MARICKQAPPQSPENILSAYFAGISGLRMMVVRVFESVDRPVRGQRELNKEPDHRQPRREVGWHMQLAAAAALASKICNSPRTMPTE